MANRTQELRTITVGGERPIQVPTGVRMAYMDQLGRENVVFVPNILRTKLMGEWSERGVPILLLSIQSRSLWSGAPIEWLPEPMRRTRLLDAAEAQECLRPLTLTVADLLQWAQVSRDPSMPPELTRLALEILTWLGRGAMTPQQHAEWTRLVRETEPEAAR